MSTRTSELEIELLQTQGGKITYDLFYRLVALLEKTSSLDHISPLPLATLPSNLGEFDVIYVLLCRGFKDELDLDGNRLYPHTTSSDGWNCWIAGFACLVFPASRNRWARGHNDGAPGDTADITIALLPDAQKQGYGRLVVQRLVKHAFNALGIPRVTASIICPVRPSHTAATRKQSIYNTKQLCWIFERLGFKFEGVSRGAVASTELTKGEKPVWHDVYRMSMLQTDYFEKGRTYLLSHTRPFHEEIHTRKVAQSPWESMIQRQEEEKRDMQSWGEKINAASVNDACENEDGDRDSDDETVLGDGGGSDHDWDMANDFDD
ncbi:unnamed protein product [Rhizoctonia solani]|uniref:N-acetyltransferase domain-containing protein n=2 Tax=Rhizoctonia solani TaxID=456999 RepID=A0A8H3CIS0_9AGAM